MTNSTAKFRVLRLPESLRTAIRAARDATRQTTAQYVGTAVEQQLPKLIDGLRTLGFGNHGGPARPIRLPFSDEFGTLDLLREASETVGLPATRLLHLCLVAATKEDTETPAGRPEPARRRRKPRQSPGRKGTQGRGKRSP